MLYLQELVDYLSAGTNVKICIHDISGILMNERLALSERNKIHFNEFYNTAKNTQRGYNLCIACKSIANRKAWQTRKPFCGYCAWGIFEAVYPVVIKNSVQCIVYVGNVIANEDVFVKRAKLACKNTGVGKNDIKTASLTCARSTDTEKLIKTAEIIGDFITLLSDFYMYDKQPKISAENRMSKIIREYTELNYKQPVTLASLSKIYFINEKYLGRILKKSWGMSFHRYLNMVRLHNAEKLLRTEKRTVADIAFECGFENVTYFNRMFRLNYGKTPSQYRAEYTK